MLLETMIEIRESISTEKYFLVSGNHFRFFRQKMQFFHKLGTCFSMNAPFRIVETDFLASTIHKVFLRLVETYFLTNPSIKLLEKDFLFIGNHLLYLRVRSY